MSKQIILNLPVADLPKAKDFYQALGFPLNPQFTGETGACVDVSETISVMLTTHAQFREFTPKAVCDTTQAVEVLLCLTCESRAEVDTLATKAFAAGATSYEGPQDYGFMYQRSFVDLDGHGWALNHFGAPAA